MSRTIYVLLHKYQYHSDTSKPIRAFDDKEAAQRLLDSLALIVKGSLEVVELELEEVPKVPATVKAVSGLIQPSVFFGAAQGRAELP